MEATKLPASYTTVFHLMRAAGEAYTQALGLAFKRTGDPFEPITARFEVDAYLAFRLSCTLQRFPRVWANSAGPLMLAVVEAHRARVASRDLQAVFIQRVTDYEGSWNGAIDAGTLPSLPCVQLLRMRIIGAARDGRIDAGTPLDIGSGFLGEVSSTPVIVALDTHYAGTLDCIMKHVMAIPKDLGDLSEAEIVQAAARGSAEATQLLRGAQPSRRRRWWRLWL